MAVQNRIIKIQKRNRALVTFDEGRIVRAILRAAESIGGFQEDFQENVNDKIFEAYGTNDKIAAFLADAVVICLNSDPHHLITNFPPTIETIQDEVMHALRSYGFQNTADAYECYRWGRHWLREGAITETQFAGSGFPKERMDLILDWNRQRGCHTVAGLNEIVRSGKIKSLVDESLAAYEASLDEAARKVMTRLSAGDHIRMMWISGPSSSGKTTTTVKLTQRLEKHGLRFLMLNSRSRSEPPRASENPSNPGDELARGNLLRHKIGRVKFKRLDEFIDQQKTGDPELFAARLKTLTAQVFEVKKALTDRAGKGLA